MHLCPNASCKTKTNVSGCSEAENQREGVDVSVKGLIKGVFGKELSDVKEGRGGRLGGGRWGGAWEEGVTYRRLLHEAGPEPLSDATEVQVDAHQAELPSPLDELVRLHHQPLGDGHTGDDTEDSKQSADAELISQSSCNFKG